MKKNTKYNSQAISQCFLQLIRYWDFWADVFISYVIYRLTFWKWLRNICQNYISNFREKSVVAWAERCFKFKSFFLNMNKIECVQCVWNQCRRLLLHLYYYAIFDFLVSFFSFFNWQWVKVKNVKIKSKSERKTW